MGSFFEQWAQKTDPLAQALNLPGANSYSNTLASQQSQAYANTLPYAGIAPTLADANAGYTGLGAKQGSTLAPTANPNAPTLNYDQAVAYTQAAQKAGQPQQGVIGTQAPIGVQPQRQPVASPFGAIQRGATGGGANVYGY
jgi:hypothetical protein